MIGKSIQDFLGQRIIQLFNMNCLKLEEKTNDQLDYVSLLEKKRKQVLTEPYNSDIVNEEYELFKLYEEIRNY